MTAAIGVHRGKVNALVARQGDGDDNGPQITRKVENAALRILKSPFVQSLAAAFVVTGLIAFTATAFALGASLAFTIPLALITATATVALSILVYKQKDVIWFDMSLLYVKGVCLLSRFANHRVTKKVYRQTWSSPILTSHEGPNQLLLGALPLINFQHHKKISNLPGKKAAILSVVDPLENDRTGLVGDPVRPSDWRKWGYVQRQYSVLDMKGLSIAQMHEGADFIHDHIKKGHSVFVHCKAGRGRSFLMVACYLMKYEQALIEKQPGKNLVEKVCNHIRVTRPQIHYNRKQFRCLQAFAATLPQDNGSQ